MGVANSIPPIECNGTLFFISSCRKPICAKVLAPPAPKIIPIFGTAGIAGGGGGRAVDVCVDAAGGVNVEDVISVS